MKSCMMAVYTICMLMLSFCWPCVYNSLSINCAFVCSLYKIKKKKLSIVFHIYLRVETGCKNIITTIIIIIIIIIIIFSPNP